MKILLYLSHPERKSFNGQAADRMVTHFKSKGHEVKFVDLYGIKFNPVGGREDFKSLQNDEKFDYQHEQRHAAEQHLYADDVQKEMDNLKWCDLAVFQFPLYWFSVPAMVKGYFDRILAYHWAYGGGKSLDGRKIFLSTTTGGSEKMYSKDGYWGLTIDEFLMSFNIATAKLIKMECLPTFVAYGVNFAKNEEKAAMLDDLEAHIDKHILAEKDTNEEDTKEEKK